MFNEVKTKCLMEAYGPTIELFRNEDLRPEERVAVLAGPQNHLVHKTENIGRQSDGRSARKTAAHTQTLVPPIRPLLLP